MGFDVSGSSWSIVIVRDGVVYLVDHDVPRTRTVTNDAEDVVRQVLTDYPDHRIVYRDTVGMWDELRHDGKSFTGYGKWNGWVPR